MSGQRGDGSLRNAPLGTPSGRVSSSSAAGAGAGAEAGRGGVGARGEGGGGRVRSVRNVPDGPRRCQVGQ